MLNSVRFFSGLLKLINRSIADSGKPLYQIKWQAKMEFWLENFTVIFFPLLHPHFQTTLRNWHFPVDWTVNNLFSWGKSDAREKRALRKDASCVYSKMILQGVKQTQKFRSHQHLVCINRNQKLEAVWLDHYSVSVCLCVLTSPDITWESTGLEAAQETGSFFKYTHQH